MRYFKCKEFGCILKIYFRLQRIFSKAASIRDGFILYHQYGLAWSDQSISSTASILLSSKVPRLLSDVNNMNESSF